METLSIIIPIYNEEKTLEELVKRVQKVKLPLKKELILVNDCSKDKSSLIINNIKKKYKNIISLEHKINKGKGAAIKTGLKKSTGDIIMIQDADLEYNPEEIKKLITPILEGKAKVVYGSRLMGKVTGFSIRSHYYGNLFLSLMTRILYNQKITDMETCYKVMAREVIWALKIGSNRFNFEPEITAKIIKKRYKILELPINYNCRSFREGKKITWRDGIIAIYTLLKCRFTNE